MFKDHTVFVVGAGASSEFGLPLSSGLTAKIMANLELETQRDGFRRGYADRLAEGLLRLRFNGDPQALDQAWKAANLIRQGMLHAQSIDAFIDMHADKLHVATVGKLQIALEILRAEGGSELAVDRSNSRNRIDFRRSSVSTSWLRVFTEILLEKAKAADHSAIGQGVTIICFNYDRCIEHYLIEAIEATLGLSYEAAHSVVYNLNIIHPYGSLGRLPSSRGASDGLNFGADPENSLNIWDIVDGLSTFTEEMRHQDQIDSIRSAIGEAERIVCLGFGFQIQNVQLLTPSKARARRATAICTGVGTHEVGMNEIRSRLRSILVDAVYDNRREAIMLDVGCGDLMRHNRLTLSGT